MGFAFHVSDMRVEVAGLPAEVEGALRAVWQGALPLLPEAFATRFEVSRQGDRFSLHTDGELRAEGVEPAELLATVETVLYHDVGLWSAPRWVLLHAAAVHLGGVTYVLPGSSGAGKSSLAHALVQRGGLYLTDELTLFDGAAVWGVPRTPQLDVVPVGMQLPPGFPPADLESYVFRSVDGMRALPLLPLAPSQRARAPYPAESVLLVFPRQAPRTSLGSLAPSEALRRLHAEARGGVTRDLGPLLARPAWALDWRTPAEGVDALVAAREDALPER